MKLFILSILILTVSCSFKPKEKGDINQQLGLKAQLDSDGDLISNSDEESMGTNPLIADLPLVKSSFVQSYKVTVNYLEEGEEKEFIIDTSKEQDNPHFKYRVGDILIKESNQKLSAKIAKFSSHSYGDYKEHDLTWVNYPEAQTAYHQSLVAKYGYVFDKFEIVNVSLEITSSVELDEESKFNEIENLELGYRFYNYETQEYESLAESKVERVFSKGIIEKVRTTIDTINPRLIYENLFKKGEFVLSEIVNYQIPKLNTDYKSLLRSIRLKTVPVIYTTPLETKVYYVSLYKKRFNYILSTIFDSKYTIENNDLVSINQFHNNLGSYENLKDLKSVTKKGKWFVLTSKLDKHYLSHDYSNKDIISLSYIVGSQLSSSVEEKVTSINNSADSTQKVSLGNITKNSKLSFFVKGLRAYGDRVKNIKDILKPGPCRGRNCLSTDFKCYISINESEQVDESFSFKDDLSQYYLEIEGIDYPLTDYIDKEIIRNSLTDGNLFQITDLSKIHDFNDSVEVFFKILPKTETYNEGIELTNYSGRHGYYCSMHTTHIAFTKKIPLSTYSKGFKDWQRNVDFSVIKKGFKADATLDYSYRINSIIENYYN